MSTHTLGEGRMLTVIHIVHILKPQQHSMLYKWTWR